MNYLYYYCEVNKPVPSQIGVRNYQCRLRLRKFLDITCQHLNDAVRRPIPLCVLIKTKCLYRRKKGQRDGKEW
jgi:hypothetical protein